MPVDDQRAACSTDDMKQPPGRLMDEHTCNHLLQGPIAQGLCQLSIKVYCMIKLPPMRAIHQEAGNIA